MQELDPMLHNLLVEIEIFWNSLKNANKKDKIPVLQVADTLQLLTSRIGIKLEVLSPVKKEKGISLDDLLDNTGLFLK